MVRRESLIGNPAEGKRVPRGRCAPPIPPVPSEGEVPAALESHQRRGSQVIIVNKRREIRQPKSPEWIVAFTNFNHEVGGSIFLPFLSIFALSGVALHLGSITGVAKGFYRWTISCETIVNANNLANTGGTQIYILGWAKYSVTGPSPTSFSLYSGVAGSSIALQGYLNELSVSTATLGAICCITDIIGIWSYLSLTTTLVILAKTHFQNMGPWGGTQNVPGTVQTPWSVLKNFLKGSGPFGLFLNVSAMMSVLSLVACLGFYIAFKYGFREDVVSKLESELFLCAPDGGNVLAKYAYLCTCFTCVCNIATASLLKWKGHIADERLKSANQRRMQRENRRTLRSIMLTDAAGAGQESNIVQSPTIQSPVLVRLPLL